MGFLFTKRQLNKYKRSLKQSIKKRLKNRDTLHVVTAILLILTLISIPKIFNNQYTIKKDFFSDYEYSHQSDDWSANFLNKSLQVPAVKFAYANSSLEMEMITGQEGQLPTSQTKTKIIKKEDHDVLRILDIMPDTDLTYEITDNGIKEEIILKNPESIAALVTDPTYKFQLSLDNVTVKKITDTRYSHVFTDSETGEYRFHFQIPVMYDANGEQSKDIDLNINKDNEGNFVAILTPDLEWIQSPNRQYPIYIDPSIVHDTTSEFSSGGFNNTKDIGSGSSPKIMLNNQQLTSDEYTVGLWHFEEGSDNMCSGGEDACDSSGNTNDGTFNGTAAFSSTSKIGSYGVTLDGNSDYVSIAQSTSLAISSDFTLEAWVKIDSDTVIGSIVRHATTLGSCGATDIAAIVADWTSLDASGGDKVTFGYKTSTNTWNYVTSTSSINADGKWHHVAGSYDGTNINIYVDGVLENSAAQSSACTFGSNPAWLFGMYEGSSEYLNGTIDEVRISNIARTPEEIKASASIHPTGYYTSPSIYLGASTSTLNSINWTEHGVTTGEPETPANTSGLIAQWNFNETSGTIANNDAEGTSCGGTPANCDGTLTNMTTSGQDAASGDGWTSNNGKWPKSVPAALMYDGTDAYVTVADNDSLSNTTAMTWETWVKFNSLPATTDQGIISKRTNPGVNEYQLYISATDELGMLIWTSGGTSNPSTPKESSWVGKWLHITATYDSTNGAKLYVNGKLKDTAVANGTITATSGSLRLGDDHYSHYLDGIMDSTRIYSRALSAEEILSNYNASNVEFQTRSSDDGYTWEAWKPAGLPQTAESSLSISESNSSWTQNSTATMTQYTKYDLGDGSDGNCTISSGSTNLNSSSCVGRGNADSVNFSSAVSTAAKSSTITVSSTPTGLAVGDKIIVINLHGTTGDYSNVGKYEIREITSIDTNTLTVDRPLNYAYDGTTQKIMVQRVPQYNDVTISSGATMTINAYDGSKGGVLFFLASGNVNVAGDIDTSGKGYSTTNKIVTTLSLPGGGSGGGGGGGWYGQGGGGGAQGGTYGSVGDFPLLGGTGGPGTGAAGGLGDGSPGQPGGVGSCREGAGGGGCVGDGASCSGGAGGTSSSGCPGGAGGNLPGGSGGGGAGGTEWGGVGSAGTAKWTTTYGSTELSTLFLGSQGGKGGAGGHGHTPNFGNPGGDGGAGGGIIGIVANDITISGNIINNGNDGSDGVSGGGGSGGGGGGAGGSILIHANNADLGSNKITATGGTKGDGYARGSNGGDGGDGRIALLYQTRLTGSANPTAFSQQSTITNREGFSSYVINNNSSSVDSNTIALWHLDETNGDLAGDDIFDSTTNDNDGEFNGTNIATNVVDGISGKAREFNGSDDYISLSSTLRTELDNNSFSISVWFKPRAAGNLSIFATGDAFSSPGDDQGIRFFFSSTNGIYARIKGSGGNVGQYASSFTTLNQWYLATLVRDYGNNLILYVNGKEAWSLADTAGDITVTKGPWISGEPSSGASSVPGALFFNGTIDEVRISDTTRSAEEIAESYRLGSDHYISNTISSTDLSSDSKVAVDIAADKPGTYLNLTIGESAFANYQTDADTLGLWHLDESYTQDDPTSAMLSQSGLSAYTAANVVDDILSTNGWHTDSAVPGAYIKVDLGATNIKAYTGVAVYASGAYAGTYNVQYSDNDSSYTTAYTSFAPSSTGWNEVSWTNAGAHRYWRLYLTNTPGGGAWLNELDFKTSNEYKDSSSNGYHGQLDTGTSAQGKIGKGIDFSASNSKLDFGEIIPTGGSALDAFTISGWIKQDAYNEGVIFGQAPNTERVGDMIFRIDGSGMLIFERFDGTQSLDRETATLAIPTGKWIHVAGVWSGGDNGTRSLYINGVKIPSTSNNTLTAGDYNMNSTILGSAGISGYEFTGSVDEIRLDSTARTTTEIRQAYEVGHRTHPIIIEFGASLDSGHLISDSSDTSFTIDATTKGLSQAGSGLYIGDKVIIKENYGGTEYIAQGEVRSITESTGATTVQAWDASSTFPSGGFTANATVFKWQTEYLSTDLLQNNDDDATTTLSMRLTDGHQGRNIWLDNIRQATYLTDPSASANIDSTADTYFQYRALFTHAGVYEDAPTSTSSAFITDVTLDYTQNTDYNYSYWLFNEGYGNDIYDSGNHNNIGYHSSGIRTTSGCIQGGCMEFNGSDSEIFFNNSGSLSPTSGLTLSTWVYPHSISAQAFMSKDESYRLAMDASGYPICQIHNGTAWQTAATSSTTLTTNQWHHITCTYDQTNITIYLDGVQVAQQAETDPINQNTNQFFLGYDDSISGTYSRFDGLMDETRHSIDVITPAINNTFLQRAANAEGAAVTFGPKREDNLMQGLIGWWKMEESSADTCTGGVNDSCDSSGVGNDGPWSDNATNTNGRFGNGVTFDGTGDYISIDPVASNTSPTQGTFSVWVNPSTTTSLNIIGLGGSSMGSQVIQVQTNSDSFRILYRDKSNNFNIAQTSTTYTAGSWQHIVGTWNSDQLTIYINGEQEDTATIIDPITDSFDLFDIGAASNEYVSQESPWNGKLDEVRIYNRALTPAEVRQLYNYAPDPVAYYDFNENSGTSTIYDKSGNNNIGTIAGTVSQSNWVKGKFGSAFDFDGANQYINIADSASLSVTGSLTLEGWFYFDEDIDKVAYILMKDNTTTGRSYHLTPVGSGDKVQFMVSSDGSTISTRANNTALTTGTWYHIAGVFDATAQTMNVYLNGVLDNGTLTGSVPTSIHDNGSPFRFNTHSATSPAGTLDSTYDEIKIYNYARTQEQIIEDMNGGHPVGGSPVGSQVGWWKFDEGYGDTAYDSSPQGNNGDFAGSCPGTGTCPTWSNNGKYNKALTFDGGDYLTIANESDYDFSGNFTLSAWVKRDTIGVTRDERIIAKPSDTANWWELNYGFGMGSGGQDQLTCFFYTGSTWPEATFDNAFMDTDWHHVACIVTSNTLQLWMDGEKLAESSYSTAPQLSDAVVYIGASNPGQEEWYGLIDEVKIYSTALTPEQINMEYNQGKSTVLGALSTESDGNTNSFSASREYCVPGDTTSCSAPVAHWKLDENGGQYINDISGNENQGTLGASSGSDTDDPTWLPSSRCKQGSCMQFDGNNDYITNSSLSSLFSTTATIEAWIKPTTLSTTNLYTITTKASASGANRWFLRIRENGASNWKIELASNPADTVWTSIYSTTNLTENQWQHIALSFNSGSVIFYLNGVADGSNTASISTLSNSDNFEISDSSNSFSGLIDDLRIYNYARTPAQIAWDMNHGAPIAWYKLDECQGTTAYDSSGNGNNGTITIGATGSNTSTGTCSSGTGTEAWNNGTTGKRGASLNYDGTDDELVISNESNFDFNTGQQFTISAWVKMDTSDAGEKIIFDKYTTTGCTISCGYKFYIIGNTLNYYAFSGNDNKDSYRTSTTVLQPNIWYHVTWVLRNFDGADAAFYINGSEIPSSGTDNMISTSSVLNNANPEIGSHVFAGSGMMDGQIDDVKIYNYALTQQQINSDYNAGAVNFGY